MTRIVVLGAGPAGLGAALWAARRGMAVTVLERGERVGGLAGSFDVAGVRVDYGSHRLHPSTHPQVLAELRSLLGEELQLRVRRGRIRLGGRWIAFPLRGEDLIRRLPPAFALGVARDLVTRPARRQRGDSFADVLLAGLGPTMCERFYFPFARKLWGLKPAELSGEQARRRVSAGTMGALMRRVAGRDSARGRMFWYPSRGYGMLWEQLAEAAACAGAEVLLGAAVRRVEIAPKSVVVTSDDGTVAEGDVLLSTIPSTVLAEITSPAAPVPVLEAARSLEFRAMVLVYLVVAGPRYTAFDAHYFPGAFTPVTRLSEPKNYRDGDDPADRTVLCLEIPCAVGDDVWRAADEVLAAVAVDALEAAELPRPDVVGVEVRRLPRAYPVYRLGFERHLRVLNWWAESQTRVLSFGRLGLFAHDNAHHALAMALEAVGVIGDGGRVDGRGWAEARERFSRHVVED